MFVDERSPTHGRAIEVLAILDRGEYVASSGTAVPIATPQSLAERGTCLYTPAALEALRRRLPRHEFAMRVEVIAATTQEAAHEMSSGGSEVVLLNFASARNPGGGFLGGARAQEEELCRCSGLYRTLLTQPVYYETHRGERSLLYTDHAIYSPRVPFFRLSADAPLLERPMLASVITAPAPNAGAIARNQPELAGRLEATFERRWENVFAIAEDRGHAVIVVGAWGCGAFRNDPAMVAAVAKRVLASPRFARAFERVVFAIPDSGDRGRGNLASFRTVFAD